MAEAHHHRPSADDLLQPLSDHPQLLLPPATTPPPHGRRPPAPHRRYSRLGMATGGGEIVEVEGGHIVRSIGRKDRHSKVFTSKGPRDRRVRLSAHTAIQFYDVQDRLGYDRPSKAVDWLIKNAKAAIDELAEPPPRCPLATVVPSGPVPASQREGHSWEAASVSTEKPVQEAGEAASGPCGFGAGSILPPSLDSDAIADTIKSFFPMAAPATAGTSSRPAGVLRGYPPQLLQSSSAQAQDLRLSLQSFPEPVLLHHRESRQPNSSHHHHAAGDASGHANFFSTSSTHLPFDAPSASWPDLSQRMFSWNASAEMGGGGAGYILLPPTQQATPLHPVLGQSQFLSQRGPLQSSSSPQLVRAWADPSAAEAAAAALPPAPLFSAAGFAPAGHGGFRIPARIQGEEEQGGISKKPPPAASSSASRH